MQVSSPLFAVEDYKGADHAAFRGPYRDPAQGRLRLQLAPFDRRAGQRRVAGRVRQLAAPGAEAAPARRPAVPQPAGAHRGSRRHLERACLRPRLRLVRGGVPRHRAARQRHGGADAVPLRLVPAGTGPAAPDRGRADLPVAAGARARRLDRGVHRRRLGALAAHLGARLPRALRPSQHGPRPYLRHGEDRLQALPRRLHPHRGGGAGGRTGGLRGHRAPSAAAEGRHVPGHFR